MPVSRNARVGNLGRHMSRNRKAGPQVACLIEAEPHAVKLGFLSRKIGDAATDALSIFCSKKPLLDLRGNMLQPPLGAVSSILMVPGIFLKLLNLRFGGAKLSRKLVRHVESTLAIGLSHIGRPVKQAQNCSSCGI
jgi:hypothetical protein